MAERRVVITGLGTINALGTGKDEYLENLMADVIGVDRIKSFDPSAFPSQIAGEAPALKMAKIVPKAQRKSAKLMARDIELAVTAADGAIRDAGLRTRGTDPDGPIDIEPTRSGVNIGAGLICCDLVELAMAAEHAVDNGKFSLKKWGNEGMQALTPLWLLKYLPNMLSCHITIIHDLQGPSNSVTCAEASGLLAIGEAYRMIVRNKADVMIAGGADSKVNAMGLMRQCLFNRASVNYNDRPKEAYRPFDADADGSVIGEGAGIVVLEDLQRAQARGAKIYAEVTGFGASCNFSDDFIEPEQQATGIRIAMQKALQHAELQPDQISLLIPHGIGVKNHDRAEAQAINKVFGAYTKNLPILATRSRIGNCGAGGSAIDLVTAALAMDAGRIPATANCPNPPEEYGLNIINMPGGKPAALNHVLTGCYTYGGQTAAVVLSRFDDN